MLSLQTIPTGTPYRIVAVEGECTTTQRVRELGFIPGAMCTVVRRAPFGGPMEVALERRTIGLRLTSQLSILVEPLTTTGEVAELIPMPTPAPTTVTEPSVAA